jgi:AraC family transcriptional regulator
MTNSGRDRLRELLDAVLAGTDDPVAIGPRPLGAMADDAATSPFHFSRLLSRRRVNPRWRCGAGCCSNVPAGS